MIFMVIKTTTKNDAKAAPLTKDNKVLVTSALPYVNNVPHLGHIVGSHLPADIFARYCRLRGFDTLFVGGTDEHGSASEIAAARLNVPLDKFCSVLYSQHKRIYDWFGISYDNFSRTTNPLHDETTKAFFLDINSKGFIAEGGMKVLYSAKEDRFLPDRYVVGTCPKCGYKNASGDQCEKCTTIFDAVDLINPRSAISGDSLVVREAKHLFLKLDKLSPEIRAWIEKQTQWREQVSKLAMGWINEGLRERCITRDIQNGIKVPLRGFEDKVFYVWFDAPIGYISFSKEARPDDWKSFWQSDKGRIFNFLGKDNIPFHTIFWPGMVIASGEYNLPSNVIGLQYLNYEGGKFSKSQGRGVFCQNLPDADIDSDIVRGALIPLIPETSDVEFRWEVFQQAVNSDLVGNFGNMVNRTLTFIASRLDGKVERPKAVPDDDSRLLAAVKEKSARIADFLETGEIRSAFAEFLTLSSVGNKYFEDHKPWDVVKKDRQKASEILYACASFCASLAVLSSPFLPKSAERVWIQLNLKGPANAAGNWERTSGFMLDETHQIGKPALLFQKMTDEILEQFKAKVTVPTDIAELFGR